jgi:hypothetical protein
MDRTSLNLVSLILGGAGLFTVLTGFNVPQTRLSYLGENPYQIKRDETAAVMTWLFTAFALLGGAIQVIAEILGDTLPARTYTTWSYVRVAGGAGILAIILVRLVSQIGYSIARRRWLPQVLTTQRERIDRAIFAATHDGLPPEHHAERDRMRPDELARVQGEGWAGIDGTLDELDDLLALEPLQGRDHRLQRLERLRASQCPSA